uniref:Ribosomal protein L5 n=1 Tax=Heterostelium pallidum TaxID=13642 RepID=B2XX51_HETPA|nr:ribosomal protein L5 [Heterostelium pallidum]
MSFITGYTSRILSKVYLNKIGQNQTGLNHLKLKQGQIQIKVKKYNKELFDLYELVTLLEQTYMQKPKIEFTEIIERATNIKVKNLMISINLNKEKINDFFSFFLLFIVSDRKKRNILEKNNLDLDRAHIQYHLKDFKMFRKILWNNVVNIDNDMMLKFIFKSRKDVISKYRLYGFLRVLLRIKKRIYYAKK